MDFSPYDTREYPVTDVEAGYAEWAASYEDAVRDEMDLRLLARVTTIPWSNAAAAVDLACGTGRVGAWLHARGVAAIDGIDVTEAMLAVARERAIYRTLHRGDARETPFSAAAYDVATASLVDEHLPDLAPFYAEAARLLRPGGAFAIVGYHPQFMMTVGMATHFHRADGTPVAIETYVHLISDHVAAATRAGLTLDEMHEGLVDDAYIAGKPKWAKHRGRPVSFAFVWRRRA